MTAPEGETAGRAWTPDRVWLRVAGGGVTMPSGRSYTTMVGDDREQPRHVEYVRAEQYRQTIEALVGALEGLLPFAVNDGPGGCTGKYNDCDHCSAIRTARSALLLVARKEGV